MNKLLDFAGLTYFVGKLKASYRRDLATTVEGHALDATQGKALDDKKIDKERIINSLGATEGGSVLDARCGKTLNDMLAKRIALVLLYVNASPTSAFAPQTIRLDLASYSGVVVEYCENLNIFGYLSSAIIFQGRETKIVAVQHDGKQMTRSIATTNTGVQFHDCWVRNDNTAGVGTADNKYMVPYRIYGVKGVSA